MLHPTFEIAFFFISNKIPIRLRAILYFTVGMIIIKFFAIFLGLCIYANYEHCDPKLAGDIARSDQVSD